MKTNLSTFQIVGIGIRTNNQRASQDLGGLWGKFISQNISRKIPNKDSDEIFSIYTDYESDHSGDYTTIIGYRVNSLENIPAGMVSKEILSTDYQVFTAKGKFPEAVQQTWGKIWNSNLERSYQTDFEVYGAKSQNMNDAEVEIFISVK